MPHPALKASLRPGLKCLVQHGKTSLRPGLKCLVQHIGQVFISVDSTLAYQRVNDFPHDAWIRCLEAVRALYWLLVVEFNRKWVLNKLSESLSSPKSWWQKVAAKLKSLDLCSMSILVNTAWYNEIKLWMSMLW